MDCMKLGRYAIQEKIEKGWGKLSKLRLINEERILTSYSLLFSVSQASEFLPSTSVNSRGHRVSGVVHLGVKFE